jgi:hypothetical protein
MEMLSALKHVDMDDEDFKASLHNSCTMLNMRSQKPIVENAPEEVQNFLVALTDGSVDTSNVEWVKHAKYLGKPISGTKQLDPALQYLGITGKGTLVNKSAQLLAALSDTDKTIHPDSVPLRCLKKWFMKPLDGARLQGIFRKAHQMEPILLRLLNQFISSNTRGTAQHVIISDIVTCGLLESTINSILCGSPDGVCQLTFTSPNQLNDVVQQNEEPGQLLSTTFRAAIEMKYLSSKNTSGSHRDLMAEGTLDNVEFVHVKDNTPNEDFFRCCRSVAHRAQCLYHCIVLGVEWCIYVVGDDGAVCRVLVIHFDKKVIADMTNVILLGYSKYLYMFDKPESIPSRWQYEDLGWVGTVENLKQHLAMRQALRNFVAENGVQSTPSHILPAIIAEWNGKKGGVDNLSRSLSYMKGKYEAYLKPTQRILLDQIKIGILQAFHSYRFTTAYTTSIYINSTLTIVIVILSVYVS